MSNSTEDIEATQRAQDFQLGWYNLDSTSNEHIQKNTLLFFLSWKILVLSFWHACKFLVGWTIRFMDPLFFGDYPASMRKRVGHRLPRFSPVQSALIKGSFDFVGINHYTTYYAQQNVTNLIGVVLNDTIADSGALTVRKLNVLQPPMCCRLVQTLLTKWLMFFFFI